uniref:PH domain-containing protein n=1 Tax=Timema genevievae TaxID=629358 RepID=A0A7R9K1I2_TIMGE|nr:unnamed protein product [Timema genevievae]
MYVAKAIDRLNSIAHAQNLPTQPICWVGRLSSSTNDPTQLVGSDRLFLHQHVGQHPQQVFIARTAKDMYQWISSICQLSGRDAKSNIQEEKPSTSVYGGFHTLTATPMYTRSVMTEGNPVRVEASQVSGSACPVNGPVCPVIGPTCIGIDQSINESSDHSSPETRVEEIDPSIREPYPSKLNPKPNRQGLTSPKAFRGENHSPFVPRVESHEKDSSPESHPPQRVKISPQSRTGTTSRPWPLIYQCEWWSYLNEIADRVLKAERNRHMDKLKERRRQRQDQDLRQNRQEETTEEEVASEDDGEGEAISDLDKTLPNWRNKTQKV